MDTDFFAQIVEASPDLVAVFDANLRLAFVNRALEEALGRLRDDVVDRPFDNVVQNPVRDRLWRPLLQAILRDGKQRELEWGFPDVHEGPDFYESRAVARRGPSGEIQNVMVFTRRCTERHDLEKRLERLAFSDSLTGLPTRHLFENRLEQAVARSARTGNSLAVCFCDLDGFKQVNDSLGHLSGDEVLVSASRRIYNSVRTVDTVARWGGDEFVVLVEDTDIQTTRLVCNRLLAAVHDKVAVADGVEIDLSASIGVAVGTNGNKSPNALLANADSALYRAKEKGRGSIEIAF